MTLRTAARAKKETKDEKEHAIPQIREQGTALSGRRGFSQAM